MALIVTMEHVANIKNKMKKWDMDVIIILR